MNIEITGRHIEITPALHAFVEQHLAKIPRLLGDNVAIHVILTVEKRRHLCEIVLKSKTAQLACMEETNDMYASVVRASHKLEKQANKTKKKRVEVKRRKNAAPARRKSVTVVVVPGLAPSVIEESISKKPMAIEEALLNLNDSGNGFVVYRDADSQSISVVYRRKDGNIGLIRA
ncbi:MAG TPA: ribosome-associated translation inhibitor RaiA [Acidobacteriota bacterium]|jgi:putative sigma-54 modulation protein|nr:ribosome-associated translation inhibitor RaiA [Acidobacteriota bacterium]